MAGKTYFGNASSLPVFPKNIYIGNNSNQPTAVKEIYIGNSSNQPVRVWPNMVIPDANYQQVEYIGLQGSGAYGNINTGVKLKTSNPRIIAKFAITGNFPKGYSQTLWSLFKSYNLGMPQGYLTGWNCGFYQDHDNEAFCVVFGNGTSWDDDSYYGVASSSEKETTDSMEGVLKNVPYIIDFDNRSNGYSRFYLYASQGYYSLPAHNLLWTVKTPTFSAAPWEEDPYRIYFDTRSKTIFYSIKMYSTSGSLIRNYYPCYNKSNNEMGFYDIVNRVFYGSGYLANGEHAILGPDYIGEL